MRRLVLALCAVSLAALTACGDGGPPTAVTPTAPRFTVDLAACGDISPATVNALIRTVFVAGSVNANSALGRYENILKHDAAGRQGQAEQHTWDLVRFMLQKQQQGKLPVSADFSTLTRKLFCTVDIDAQVPAGGDAFIVEPSSTSSQTLTTGNGRASVTIPANALGETSIIAIAPTPDTLRTNLDKYPTNYDFSKYPIGAFELPVIASMCVTADIAQVVLDRLVLGHNIGVSGFELLPDAPPQGITCTDVASREGPPSVGDRLLALLLPKVAHAARWRGAVGVGGSVIEFSEIGPVDPVIVVAANPATGTSAPAGGLVTPPPSVTLTTPNGKALSGIPVTFATSNSGGSIGPSPVNSGATGTATVAAWQLAPTPGVNTATATPGLGGPAVAGVIFSPASTPFSATGTAFSFPATLVAFGSGDYRSYPDQPLGGAAPTGWPAAPASSNATVGSQSPFRGPSGLCTITSTPGTSFPVNREIFVVKTFNVPVAGSLTVTLQVDNDVRIWVDGVERTSALAPTANYQATSGFWTHEGCADVSPPTGTFAVTTPGAHTIALWARDRGGVTFLDMQVVLNTP